MVSAPTVPAPGTAGRIARAGAVPTVPILGGRSSAYRCSMMTLPVAAAVFPIAPLLIAPLMAMAIMIIHIDADTRIIIVAVPAERVVAAIAIIGVVTVAAVSAVAYAKAHAAVRMIAVTIPIHPVGAAAEREAARKNKNRKAKSRSVH